MCAEAENDPRVRVLVVGCSIGRGVADEHSDIDAYMAVSPEAWPAYWDDAPAMIERLGDVLDQSHKSVTLAEGDPYRSSWALFRDGVELDLVIARAPAELHPARDWVVLHDPDGRLGDPRPIRFATEQQVREWGYEGWATLLLGAKYLSRSSLWEALEALHIARTRVWRLRAAARHIPDAPYGLTAVLDHGEPSPPPGIEATQAPLEKAALVRAALACVDLLDALWPDATATVSGSPLAVPPVALATRQKLASLLTGDNDRTSPARRTDLRYFFAFTARRPEVADFYGDVLGLAIQETKDDAVWFGTEGARFSVHDDDDRETAKEVRESHAFVMGVGVDHLDATFERARRSGAVVERFESWFFVRDPDGRYVIVSRKRGW